MTLSDSELQDVESKVKQANSKQESSKGGGKKRSRFNPDDEPEDEYMDDESWELWRYLPLLQGIPEHKLRRMPNSFMFKLNSALQFSSTYEAKMSTASRLAANADRIFQHPITLGKQKDNRNDVLHEARFLGGAACSPVDLWLHARRVLGEKGVTAIGSYDLDAVGAGGSVTPKGWMEIHNPSSAELKLKLFHMPNVANSGMTAKKVSLDGGEDGLSIGDSLREIADLESFRAALNNAREAMLSALPWNRSISAVAGFFQNNCYLQASNHGT